jgi:peptidoglycan/xylan/chitin deacetylase (PgdA/CDA1 family)
MTVLSRSFAKAATLAEPRGPQRLSILIFHRVLAKPDPLFPGEMDAARFDHLMRHVAAQFNVVTLAQAASLRQQQRLPQRALAITFDDGYADNAELALPILQRHGLRASFFVATGFLDGGRMWNDSVIETVRATTREPLPSRTIAERRAAIAQLLPRIKYLGLAERNEWLASLHRAAGAPALPGDLMMRSEQVVLLHRAGMEIGAHTVAHPILRVLPDAEAEAQITQGRDDLQRLIGQPIEVFAYPNGKPDQDYDRRHVAMVSRAGFKLAVSTAQGTADRHSLPLEMPRFTPWDRSPLRWLARLWWMRLAPPQAAVARSGA